MLFPPPPDHSLTPGSIAGIVIAVLGIAGVAIVVVIIVVIFAARKIAARKSPFMTANIPMEEQDAELPDVAAAPPPDAQVLHV